MDIVVNGQSYDSWDAVPEEIRQRVAAAGLPDADGNGIPDLFEGKGGLPEGATSTTSTSISIDGQPIGSFSELPAFVQQALQGMTAPPVPSVPSAETSQAPAPGQIVLNGETISADSPQEEKGFFKRLFGG